MSMVRSFFGTKETNNASKVSIYLDMFSGHPDMIQVDRYLTRLKKGRDVMDDRMKCWAIVLLGSIAFVCIMGLCTIIALQ